MKNELNCNISCKDPAAWKIKATAFAIRTHNHLWGKNNEDPLVFLYRQGISHEFSRQMYLGWNKYGQHRPCQAWGLSGKESFSLPPGIVFPYIIEKNILGIYIISMENPETVHTIPGSFKDPLVLGEPDKEARYTDSIMEGLNIFQDHSDKLCVHITLPSQYAGHRG